MRFSLGAPGVAALAFLVAGEAGTVTVAGAQAGQPTFRSSVDLVPVDVVVVDREGRHVRGLTRDAFEIYDNGRRVTISAFDEVTLSAARQAALASALPANRRADVGTNAPGPIDRIVVLVIDDLHIYRERTDQARQIARRLLDELSPDASMAVLFTSGDGSTRLTRDRPALYEAVGGLRGRQAVRRPHPAIDAQRAPPIDPEASLDTILAGVDRAQRAQAGEFFDNMALYRTLAVGARFFVTDQTRRKAFILLSEGVSKDLAGLFETPPRDCVGACYHEDELHQMMRSLNRANVSTYAIDPRGHVSAQDLLRELHPAPPGLLSTMAATPDDEDSPFRWNNPIRQAQTGLGFIAEASGGFAVTNTNDFDAGIGSILDDLDHYYLLGFSPDEPGKKGARRLEVRVRTPGYVVRARHAYEGGLRAERPAATPRLGELVSGTTPVRGLPMRLGAVALPLDRRTARVAVALELTVPRKDLEMPDQRLLDEVRYGLFALDEQGSKVHERVGKSARIALRPAAGGGAPPETATFEILTSLDLGPGRYELRASATTARLGTSGSVFLPLDVPDFARAGLAMSDLVVAHAGGPRVAVAHDAPAAGAAPVRAWPVEPTLDRTFTPRDTIRLYARAVSLRPEPLTAVIAALAMDGAPVLSLTRPLTSGAAPALDVSLPLAQLRPGRYRLHVTIAGRADSVEREVFFAVEAR